MEDFKNLRVLIRADSSSSLGLGHLSRCLALADELLLRGAEVIFACRALQGNFLSLIDQEKFKLILLPMDVRYDFVDASFNCWENNLQNEDALATLHALGGVRLDLVIIDHYLLDSTWHSKIKKHTKKLMVIDDVGNRKLLCDFLLDQNFGATEEKYRGVLIDTPTFLLGGSFALLHRDFRNFRSISLRDRHKRDLQKILISVGGSDPDGNTLKVLTELEKSNTRYLTECIVLHHPSQPRHNEVCDKIKSQQFDCRLVPFERDMAKLLVGIDLVIGASGSSTWERCCLGVPAIQIVTAENQMAVSEYLRGEGACVIVSDFSEIPSSLDFVRKNIYQMSANAAKICDGLGASAVAELLSEKMK